MPPALTPAKPSQSNFTKGISLGLLTVLLASCVAAMGKHLSGMVNIATIVLFQYSICLLLTLPWVRKNGIQALKTQHLGRHIVRSVSGCFCFFMYYLAIKHIPLTDAALLRNTAPLLVPVILFVGFHTTIAKARWLPLIIGFMGVTVILRPGQGSFNLWYLVGLASGIGLAISMVYTSLLSKDEPKDRILFYYFFISLLFAIPFFISHYQVIPLNALPWLAAIGVIMYFTFGIYTRAYGYVSASTIAPTNYFSVVFTGLLDWIFWQQLPDLWTIAGTVLVVTGGLLVLKTGEKS